MARRKRGRDISGFLILDKPQGPTSNHALQTVRRLFDARKAGHTGTLDPLATGMLPICFGEATKTAALAIQADKVYEATGRLGIATDTADALGKITATAGIENVDASAIATVLADFVGTTAQLPPRYSAIRHRGKRLYELARAGIDPPREPRDITIHSIELCSVELPKFTIRVHCGKGTYIRTLVEDIGARLGTLAHVSALRRISVDPFTEQPMISVTDLEAAVAAGDPLEKYLLPVDYVLSDWRRVDVSATDAQRLRQGQKLRLDDPSEPGKVRVYDQGSAFVGIAEVSDSGELSPRRIFL